MRLFFHDTQPVGKFHKHALLNFLDETNFVIKNGLKYTKLIKGGPLG